MKKRLIKKFCIGKPYPVRIGVYALQHFTRLKNKAKKIYRKERSCSRNHAVINKHFELMQEFTWAFSLTLQRRKP